MPNHCGNKLILTGTKKDLDEFQKFAVGKGVDWDGKLSEREAGALDLNQFVPCPDSIRLGGKNGRDAYNSGGYDWCCSAWGTKWGCYDIDIVRTINLLVYTFNTAWSPFGDNVLQAMSEKFPRISFTLKYAEVGCNYYGIVSAKAGAVEQIEYGEFEGKHFGNEGQLLDLGNTLDPDILDVARISG